MNILLKLIIVLILSEAFVFSDEVSTNTYLYDSAIRIKIDSLKKLDTLFYVCPKKTNINTLWNKDSSLYGQRRFGDQGELDKYRAPGIRDSMISILSNSPSFSSRDIMPLDKCEYYQILFTTNGTPCFAGYLIFDNNHNGWFAYTSTWVRTNTWIDANGYRDDRESLVFYSLSHGSMMAIVECHNMTNTMNLRPQDINRVLNIEKSPLSEKVLAELRKIRAKQEAR